MGTEVNTVISNTSTRNPDSRTKLPTWLKVGAVAATSALAGGLAAAWFYRKAVSRLQNAESLPDNSNFRISGAEDRDEE